jgi:AAA+ superfamily predicted ATPase
MIARDSTARFILDRLKALFSLSAVYRFECDAFRSTRTWSEKSYHEMEKTQLHTPVEIETHYVVRSDGPLTKTWWLFQGQFYWDDQQLKVEQVKTSILDKIGRQAFEKQALVKYLESTLEELDALVLEAYQTQEPLMQALKVLLLHSCREGDLLKVTNMVLAENDDEAANELEYIFDVFRTVNIKFGNGPTAVKFAEIVRAKQPEEFQIDFYQPFREMTDAAYAITKTKGMYLRFATAVVRSSGKRSETEDSKLLVVKRILGQSDPGPIVQRPQDYSITDKFEKTSDPLTVIQYVKNTIEELNKPIIERMPQLKGQLGEVTVFHADLTVISQSFAIADGDVSETTAGFILEAFRTLRPGWGLDLTPIMKRDQLREPDSARDTSILLAFRILPRYDAIHGTHFNEKAKEMYYRFATAIVAADGEITKAEEVKLAAFRQELWPDGTSVIRSESSKEVAITRQERTATGLIEEASQTQSQVTTQIEPASLGTILAELNSLVGLDAVKTDVTQLVNYLKVQQLKHSKGMRSVPISLHHVFYGNPGTGKTSVARLLAQIYQSLGILSKGHLVETDRSGLVAGYLGQTALKVNEVVSKALGGILFIDEAYSLTKRGDSYGDEAIEVLIKQMEDHRDDLIVIVAGYTDKMDEFLSSNPGLHSRFNKYLKFQDYSPAELAAIFERFASKEDMHLSPEAREKLLSVFQSAYNTRDNTFGNGRYARNLYEQIITRQANRIISLSNVTDLNLSTIEAEDVPTEVSDSRRLT